MRISLLFSSLYNYNKCLNIRKIALTGNHPDFDAAYNNIGGVHNNLGDYSKALEYYNRCLNIVKMALPSSQPSLALSYSNIAFVCCTRQDYETAHQYSERVLKILRVVLPLSHPHRVSTEKGLRMTKLKLCL